MATQPSLDFLVSSSIVYMTKSAAFGPSTGSSVSWAPIEGVVMRSPTAVEEELDVDEVHVVDEGVGVDDAGKDDEAHVVDEGVGVDDAGWGC